MAFFIELKQTKKSNNSYGNIKQSLTTKAFLSRKSNVEGIAIPDLRLCYRVIVTKTAWHKHRKDHKTRIEDL